MNIICNQVDYYDDQLKLKCLQDAVLVSQCQSKLIVIIPILVVAWFYWVHRLEQGGINIVYIGNLTSYVKKFDTI